MDNKEILGKVPYLIPTDLDISATLSPWEESLLKLVTGNATVKDICVKSGWESSLVVPTIVDLSQIGVIGFLKPTASKSQIYRDGEAFLLDRDQQDNPRQEVIVGEEKIETDYQPPPERASAHAMRQARDKIIDDPQSLENFLSSVPKFSKVLDLKHLEMDPIKTSLLVWIDGKNTVRDLISLSGAGSSDVITVMVELLNEHMVSFSQPGEKREVKKPVTEASNRSNLYGSTQSAAKTASGDQATTPTTAKADDHQQELIIEQTIGGEPDQSPPAGLGATQIKDATQTIGHGYSRPTRGDGNKQDVITQTIDGGGVPEAAAGALEAVATQTTIQIPAPPVTERVKPTYTMGKSVSGDLATKAVDTLIGEYSKKKKTGVLQIISKNTKRMLYFKAGDVTLIESDLPEDRIIQLLLQAKRLSENQLPQLDDALKLNTAQQLQYLISIELMQEGEDVFANRWRAERIISQIVFIDEGRYTFTEMDDVPAGQRFSWPDIPRAIYSISKAMDLPVKIKEMVEASIDNYLVKTDEILPIMKKLKLSTSEARLMEVLLNRPWRVREIYDVSTMPRRKTTMFIWVIVTLGACEFREISKDPQLAATEETLAEIAQRMKKRNYFEQLEVHEIANTADVEKSFDKIRAHYESPHIRSKDPEAADLIIDMATKAYHGLLDPQTRQQYRFRTIGKEKCKFYSQMQFKKGEVYLFWKADLPNALKFLESAYELDPENGEYIAHLALARFRENPKAGFGSGKVKPLLEQALKYGMKAPLVHICIARIQAESGQRNIAMTSLNRALNLAPEDNDVLQTILSVKRELKL